jgi:hypothetical protein
MTKKILYVGMDVHKFTIDIVIAEIYLHALDNATKECADVLADELTPESQPEITTRQEKEG